MATEVLKPETESLLESGDERLDKWKEVKQQLYIAAPMICVNLLQFLIQLSSVMFIGHLGKLALSSASLATSSCSVTGFTIMMGMAAALETLCGQAYGAKQYSMMGVFLQRAVLVLALTSIPISLLWLNMRTVLEALGQDPTISFHAGQYAKLLIPGLFAYTLVQPLVKFLQSQSAVVPMAVCTLATLLVHIPLCWLLIFKLNIGAKGAAVSVSISYWLNAIFLASYVAFSKRCKQTWSGFSRAALQDFQGFFKLAVPSAVMICLESWAFEFVTLLSGLLPNPQLETSSFSCTMNTLVSFYMIPLGLSAAASTRAANELGAGRPRIAKAAVGVTICMGLVDSALVITFLLSVRKVLGWAYSNEQEVVDHVASLFKIAIFIAAFDPIQGVLTGVSRGCGWQAIGALANLLAFYVVGLPIAIVAAFVFKLRGKGLWLGIACGNATQTLVLCIITLCTNWHKQADNARRRLTASDSLVLKRDGEPEPQTVV